MSYHVFVLSVGKEGVERIHVLDEGQGQEGAEKSLKRSQRKRVIGYRLAHPTSHYRVEIADREAGRSKSPTRKRRRA